VVWLGLVTLRGADVTLEPLGLHRAEELSTAVRDGAGG
jgi:hypothetical protein